jgi:hypothetical protein
VREADNLTTFIWEPKPPGTLWATPGLLRDCFTFTFVGYLAQHDIIIIIIIAYKYRNFKMSSNFMKQSPSL